MYKEFVRNKVNDLTKKKHYSRTCNEDIYIRFRINNFCNRMCNVNFFNRHYLRIKKFTKSRGATLFIKLSCVYWFSLKQIALTLKFLFKDIFSYNYSVQNWKYMFAQSK